MDEETRVRHDIAEAKERTKERKALAARAGEMKKVDDETKEWMSHEMEHRREMIADQRKQSREAIEARRLALLKQRHADFVAKKEETANARATIQQARTAKQAQKQAQMLSVRERMSRAKERNRQLSVEKAESNNAHAAILASQEEAEVKHSLREIDELAREEERLLKSVLTQHAEHRLEFDTLQKRIPAYSRGLTTNPSPFSLPQPLAADSPLNARRPATSLDGSRTDGVRLVGTMPAMGAGGGADFGNSGRSCFSGQYGYGNSVPSTPRTGMSRPATSHMASSMPASPRARQLAERPISQGSQRAPGCTCSASVSMSTSSRLSPTPRSPTPGMPPVGAIQPTSKLPYA